MRSMAKFSFTWNGRNERNGRNGRNGEPAETGRAAIRADRAPADRHALQTEACPVFM